MTINVSPAALSVVSSSSPKLDGLPKVQVEQESSSKLPEQGKAAPVAADNLTLLKASERQEALAAESKSDSSSQPADRQQLDSAVTQLNDFVQSIQRDLRFSIDDDSGTVVVKVIDRSSGDVIRQVPQENVLKMVRDLQEFKEGQLFEAKA